MVIIVDFDPTPLTIPTTFTPLSIKSYLTSSVYIILLLSHIDVPT